MNALRSAQNAALARQKSDMTKLSKDKENIIQAIKDGVPASMVKDELEQVSAKLDELASSMKEQDQGQQPLIHPSMARRYREQIENLRGLLEGGQAGQAREHVREAIDKIVLTPKEDRSELAIDLYGSLAGILKIASEDKSMKNRAINKKRLAGLVANDNYSNEPSVQLVAGAGCQRYLPLITAYDIASNPLQEAALLSVIEGVRASKDAYSTSNSAHSATGGQKNV